ncbi:MAG: ATP synthase F1 subunit epsilon [Erysipelotrichaceae bacterium]|nr:ATP synthase F1 subunit epsilon [Erysipelotrichaceae bacterium]
MKLFPIQILTPDREVFRGDVRRLHVPTESGPYTLHANTYPFIVMIKYGNLWLETTEGRSDYAISGGILIVQKEIVTVLAEAIERADEIDVDRALAAKERAESRLAKKSEKIDIKRAQTALLRALNRLDVAGYEATSIYKFKD